MRQLNDIAILLTQKIEHDLVYEFHSKKESPSFSNIRETILNTLRKYVEVFHSKTLESEMELKQIPEKHRIGMMNQKLEKECHEMTREILKRDDIIEKFEWSDGKTKEGYSIYKSTTKYLPVIKLNKLIKETDDDYFKGRF